jgi:hypothetical protein
MLLTHARWQTFTSRPIPATDSSEVMLALALTTRAAVDSMTTTAGGHGGHTDMNPLQELGFMYSRSLADPDGHVWEASWMDPAAITGESTVGGVTAGYCWSLQVSPACSSPCHATSRFISTISNRQLEKIFS